VTESFRLGSDGIYRCDGFQEFVWQKHGFGTRTANPEADILLQQVHSNLVCNTRHLSDRVQKGDALVTDEVGKSIGVRTADCVPILLLDRKHCAVAAVHAGWRGTAGEIIKSAVQAMVRDFASEPSDVYAAIGPCVRVCCYEVGADVAERFNEAVPERNSSSESQKRNVNLAEANTRQLLSLGVPADQVFDCCMCTACDSAQFYSYRREPGTEERMIAAIARLA
jgi:YfiH family protein